MNQTNLEKCIQSVQRLGRAFDPKAVRGDDIEIQFVFDDEGKKGACYLHILRGSCAFRDGEALFPKVTVKSACDVWLSILAGELSWEKALMERRFIATGNFPLIAQFPKIFDMSALSGSLE